MQLENYISNFTNEQSKILHDLSTSEDKKEIKMLHKKLKLIISILNNLITYKSISNNY